MSEIKIEASKIELSADGQSTFVNVYFSEKGENGSHQSGRIEVKLPSQDYTLSQVKEAAITQARDVLRRIANHDS